MCSVWLVGLVWRGMLGCTWLPLSCGDWLDRSGELWGHVITQLANSASGLVHGNTHQNCGIRLNSKVELAQWLSFCTCLLHDQASVLLPVHEQSTNVAGILS